VPDSAGSRPASHDAEATPDLRIDAELVRLLYDYGRWAKLGVAVLAVITAVFLWGAAPPAACLGFAGAAVAIALARFGLDRAYRHATLADSRPALWGRLYTATCLLSGLLWAAGAIWLFVPDSLPHQALLAVAIAGVTAGSVVSNAVYLPAFYVFFVPALGTMAARFLLAGDPLQTGLGIMALVYAVVFIFFAHMVHRVHSRALALRFENLSLIRRLEQSRERAEAANRAKSHFLAAMSHEMRTPMNAILGFSEVIRDGLLGEERREIYRRYAGDIHDSGAHLLLLINDILDLSKVESGRFELSRERFDLIAELDECRRLLDRPAREAGLQLRFDGAAPAELHADRRAVRQMVLNVVENAIKFTETGGAIDIAVVRDATGELVVSIADNGIGMAPEDVEQAFERFCQLGSPFIDSSNGAGLGLSLVKGLIELHDGRVEIDSEPGIGTQVLLIFPPQAVAAAQAA